MKQQTNNRYVAVTHQVNRVRRIYSDIGQPLPAEIIIDLHHYLGAAMELHEKNTNNGFFRKKKTGKA